MTMPLLYRRCVYFLQLVRDWRCKLSTGVFRVISVLVLAICWDGGGGEILEGLGSTTGKNSFDGGGVTGGSINIFLACMPTLRVPICLSFYV